MLDPTSPIGQLLKDDPRYSLGAYLFVFEALRYAQEEMGLGVEIPSEVTEEDEPEESSSGESSGPQPRHLTGQQLCEAMRQYALEQYGYMAKCVFNQWGVESTSDFGEIVFNLIRVGEMRKTPQDRREDFNDVFDFDEGLTKRFEIELPE